MTIAFILTFLPGILNCKSALEVRDIVQG
jgi:hypothetical protein